MIADKEFAKRRCSDVSLEITNHFPGGGNRHSCEQLPDVHTITSHVEQPLWRACSVQVVVSETVLLVPLLARTVVLFHVAM